MFQKLKKSYCLNPLKLSNNSKWVSSTSYDSKLWEDESENQPEVYSNGELKVVVSIQQPPPMWFATFLVPSLSKSIRRNQ